MNNARYSSAFHNTEEYFPLYRDPQAAPHRTKGKEAGEPTLSEFIAIVGKLGGHLGRKSDGAPGPQSIWQGLARIRDFACAWHAFHEK